MLKPRHDADPKYRAVIRGDENVPAEAISRVMNACGAAGISDIAFLGAEQGLKSAPCASSKTPTKAASVSQIAPMIDVVFVIMLFFMVMAGAVKRENELNTTLPGSAETSQQRGVRR